MHTYHVPYRTVSYSVVAGAGVSVWLLPLHRVFLETDAGAFGLSHRLATNISAGQRFCLIVVYVVLC